MAASKNFRYINLFMMILFVCLISGSCTNYPAPLEDFLIKVDSIHLPNTFTSNIPFDIEFFGTIGFDECHSFKSFNQIINSNIITVEAWGTFDNKPDICPEAKITLDGHKLNMTIPFPGIYTIRIKEPGYYLVNQIVVN
jgi:hypothetical protein